MNTARTLRTFSTTRPLLGPLTGTSVTRVFAGNLPQDATNKSLRATFAPYGLRCARMIKSKHTNPAAFVDFISHDAQLKALADFNTVDVSKTDNQPSQITLDVANDTLYSKTHLCVSHLPLGTMSGLLMAMFALYGIKSVKMLKEFKNDGYATALVELEAEHLEKALGDFKDGEYVVMPAFERHKN